MTRLGTIGVFLLAGFLAILCAICEPRGMQVFGDDE